MKETVAPFPLFGAGGYAATVTGADGKTAGQNVPLCPADSIGILCSSGASSLLRAPLITASTASLPSTLSQAVTAATTLPKP